MSLPINYTLNVYQGATFVMGWRWVVDGTGKDLTGWSGRMQVRSAPGAVDEVFALVTGTTGIALDSDGHVTIRIEADASTAVLDTDTIYVYDLELVAPDGDVTRFAMGKVKISPEVTV